MTGEMYKMTISLNVLSHLGINLYSNIPAVLSEVVANSWDADAEVVAQRPRERMYDFFAVGVEVGNHQQYQPILPALTESLGNVESRAQRTIAPADGHGDAILHRHGADDRRDGVFFAGKLDMVRL